MLRRSKSSRPPPAKPTPRQQAQSIAGYSKIDDAELLEAVLSGASETDIVTQGKRATARQVVDDAFAMYHKAWEFVRRLDPSRKSVLRGCSRDLLILAARQAILLDDLLIRQEANAKEQADAHQKGRQQLQAAFDKATKLRDQARRLFNKIVGTDAAAQAETNVAALAEDSGGSIVDALEQLAQYGRRLLSDDDPTRRQCVRIYGLDAEYVQMLIDSKEELIRCESEFESLAEAGNAEEQIHWCAGVNLLLMTQIIEAFLGANELDSSVPFLRPAHHEHLVRRISRLPPPPLPRALAPKVTGISPLPAPAAAAKATRQYVAAPVAPRIAYAEERRTGPVGLAFKGRLGGR
ncbi:MAG: hypothetical protein HY898_33505 [Deltaproteobacteria bacterium]|nr:hypothetical protein [Deltaproteobacteria bacterium]